MLLSELGYATVRARICHYRSKGVPLHLRYSAKRFVLLLLVYRYGELYGTMTAV